MAHSLEAIPGHGDFDRKMETQIYEFMTSLALETSDENTSVSFTGIP